MSPKWHISQIYYSSYIDRHWEVATDICFSRHIIRSKVLGGYNSSYSSCVIHHMVHPVPVAVLIEVTSSHDKPASAGHLDSKHDSINHHIHASIVEFIEKKCHFYTDIQLNTTKLYDGLYHMLLLAT